MASGYLFFNGKMISLLDLPPLPKTGAGAGGAMVKENRNAPLKVLLPVPVYSSDEDDVETEGIRKLLTKQEIKKLGLRHLYEMYDIFGNGLDKRRAEKAEALIESIFGTKQVSYMELSIRCKDFVEYKGMSAITGSSNQKIMHYLQELKYALVKAPKRPMVVLGKGVAVHNQIAIPQQIAPKPLLIPCDVCMDIDDNITEEIEAIVAAQRGDYVDFTNDVRVDECKLSPKRLAEFGIIGQPVPAKTSNVMVYIEEDLKKMFKYSIETVIDAPVEVPNYSSFVLKRYKDNNVGEVRMQLRRQTKIKDFVNENRHYVKTQTETIHDYFLSDLTILRESIDYASKLFLYVESIKTLLVSKNNADDGEASLVNEYNLCAYGSLDEIIDLLDKLMVQQMLIDEHVAKFPDQLNVLMAYYCQLKKSFRYFVYILVKVIKPLTLQVYSEHQDSICKWFDGLSDKLNQLMMSNFCKTRELAVDPVYGFKCNGGAWIPLDQPIRRNNGNNLKSKYPYYYALPCMCSYKKGGPYDTHKMLF